MILNFKKKEDFKEGVSKYDLVSSEKVSKLLADKIKQARGL